MTKRESEIHGTELIDICKVSSQNFDLEWPHEWLRIEF